MKREYAKYIILITAALIYAAVCFICPEQAEAVGSGWQAMINGLMLLIGV